MGKYSHQSGFFSGAEISAESSRECQAVVIAGEADLIFVKTVKPYSASISPIWNLSKTF